MADEKKPGFAEKLETLNEIVAKIESGSLPLEESIKLYEQAKKLVEELEKQLEEAQKKIGEFEEVNK